ncbi:MAG: HAD-IIB family hydrolase [Campylobacterota bacterium]|nr:HAD-IIB family hydrolase [Campylobacterota bacterium]
MKKIIFTDLDGTFLNHHDYSFQDSAESLQKVKLLNIALIFTTSKTKIEVELLQKKVEICEPFIVENGAALFIPRNYQNLNLDSLDDFEEYKILQFGQPYQKILEFYNEHKVEFKMRGFSDMSDEELSKLTSLHVKSVKFSKMRDFSEPFILDDESRVDELKRVASTCNLKITKGGRFYHLIGENQDKGIAVRKSVELFEKLYGEKITSIALGDGENDVEMLKSVDVPIVIKNHKNEHLHVERFDLQKSTFQGSKGWNEMVLKNV